MSFHPATEQYIYDWLRTKCPDLVCPACGSDQWTSPQIAYGTIVHLTPSGEFQTPPFPLPNQLPLLYLFCGQCACSVSFSVGVMGLIKAP